MIIWAYAVSWYSLISHTITDDIFQLFDQIFDELLVGTICHKYNASIGALFDYQFDVECDAARCMLMLRCLLIVCSLALFLPVVVCACYVLYILFILSHSIRCTFYFDCWCLWVCVCFYCLFFVISLHFSCLQYGLSVFYWYIYLCEGECVCNRRRVTCHFALAFFLPSH